MRERKRPAVGGVYRGTIPTVIEATYIEGKQRRGVKLKIDYLDCWDWRG